MALVVLLAAAAVYSGWKLFDLSRRVDASLHGVPRLLSTDEYAARRRRIRGERDPLPGARLR